MNMPEECKEVLEAYMELKEINDSIRRQIIKEAIKETDEEILASLKEDNE